MKTFLKIASFLYFILLIYIFFLAWRRPSISLHVTGRALHLTPLYDKISGFRHASVHSLHSLKETIALYLDFFGNILLFMPFAFILSVVFNIKNTGKIILIAFLVSVLVETIQWLLGIGVADIDDVILNTTGTCIGLLLLKYLRHLKDPTINKFLYPA